MNRRLLLSLAALAVALAWGAAPGARADRLGGNYRGPGDLYVLREDAKKTAPEAGDAGGASGSGSTPSSEGSGEGDGSTGEPAEGTSSGDSGSGEDQPPPPHGGEYRGPAGEGDGGEGSGEPPPSGPDTGGSPDAGGAEDSGGDGEAPGGSAPPPPPSGSGPGGSEGAPSAGAPSSSSSLSGRRPAQDDKDRIWPFYFEGAREEYLASVMARRPAPRLSPPGTSTFLLSTQPAPAADRTPLGERDRREAFDLALGRILDPDSHVRDAAAIAIGKSGFREAIPHLRRLAETDPDPAVREDALLALGLSGHAEAQPILLRALASPPRDRRERRASFAALGLGLLGRPGDALAPLRALYGAASARAGMEEEAAAAAAALGMLGDGGALPLFERTLASRGATAGARCFTLHALGKFGAHGDPKVRRAALRILLASLQAGRAEARPSALLALGSFDDMAAVQALVAEGLGKPEPYGRCYAAHSLGRIAARTGPSSREYAVAGEELAKASDGFRRDRWLAQAGTLSLAGMGSGGGEEALLEKAGDLRRYDGHVASSVVLALGLAGSGGPETGRTLSGLFSSRSSGSDVRAYAGLSMAMAATPGAAAELSASLAGDGRPPADVARTAALALGLVGGAEEARLLVDVLAGKVAFQEAESARFFLRGAAVQAIGIIGDAGTVKHLRPLLESRGWEERAFATAALGYLAEPRAEERIAPRLSGIFRHHDYHLSLPLVRTVQGTL